MSKQKLDVDNIAAVATPPGRGGVAIVRISGKNLQSISQSILHQTLKPRVATLASFYAKDDTIIDNGIAIYFPAPNSFTGEDVLELHAHGSPIVLDMLLENVIAHNVRLARPGEFSERAFLNGKMDLAQAEAVADLIDAASRQAARSAIRSLLGEFSKQIHQLKNLIITLRVYVEAQIDFSDEEIDVLNTTQLTTQLQNILTAITKLLQNAEQGSLLRDGFTAIIMGKPNVGKSSLLNYLSGKDRAIVTDIPGTTRDLLHEDINIDGMPMHLIDTAGLRDSNDQVEQEGIRRAYQEAENADIILYLIDNLELVTNFPNEKIIFIVNKIDLINQEAKLDFKDKYPIVYLSAKTGAGITLLIEQIKNKLGIVKENENLYLARRRHINALETTSEHLQNALPQLSQKILELTAEELRLAQNALQTITGEFTSDDLLGEIFASFCIGK